MASRSQLALFGPQLVPHVSDITARKHKGNKQSVKANERNFSKAAAMRERCRIFIDGCGFHGATSKEIGKAFGLELHIFSGRLSQLKEQKQVFDSGRERENAAVLVSRKEWCNSSD